MEMTPVSRLTAIISPVVDNPSEVAESLFKTFGSANLIFGADEWSLNRAAPTVVVAHLSAIKAWMREALHMQIKHGVLIKTNDAVREYLRFEMSSLQVEQFRVLYLTKSMNLIADEVAAVGNEWAVNPSIAGISRRAMELDAKVVILAHNHPGGSTTPSRGDISITNALKQTAYVLGFEVFDHIIVAKDQIVSMRDLGLI